jgi:hypothetical protein
MTEHVALLREAGHDVPEPVEGDVRILGIPAA